MKLYRDENLSPRVAEVLRARGLDAVSAHETGSFGMDDRGQLDYASREARVLVTCDVSDFPGLATVAITANAWHAGIILISPSLRTAEFAAIARAIEDVVERYPRGLDGRGVYATRGRR